MKVIVLGSGVIGVSTAYYLARAGHEVTVIDRQAEPAQETSFANAGEVSPGYSSPWAGPGVPVKAVKWLLMKHGPLVIRPKLDPVMWIWLLKMLRNCTSARYAINKGRMIPIAEYSRNCLRALRSETGIHYDERAQGTLQLFRQQSQLDDTGDDIAVLKQYGVPYEVLGRDGCIAAEPALAAVKDKIAGGLRLPQDETGDCHMFTQALAVEAEKLGVRFAFDVGIQGSCLLDHTRRDVHAEDFHAKRVQIARNVSRSATHVAHRAILPNLRRKTLQQFSIKRFVRQLIVHSARILFGELTVTLR